MDFIHRNIFQKHIPKHHWNIPMVLGLRVLEYSYGCSVSVHSGQNEPATTNAAVGRSVHWMGCIFSFGVEWGSSQSISFCY
jgi:hypothetical protein